MQGKAPNNPIAADSTGEHCGELRAGNGTHRQCDRAANAVMKEAGGNVRSGAGKRSDRQHKQRCRGGRVHGKAQQLDQRGDVEKATADPEKT